MINNTTQHWYQAKEFAALTGVTVRTLHHYDAVGLLKPSGRTRAGYRLYVDRDFARLQQIVTLKFIGFSLQQIKELVLQGAFNLSEMLRLQRDILTVKRQHLDKAVEAIEKVEGLLAKRGEPDWQAFTKIIEVINMSNTMDWAKKYYSEEAQKAIEERAKLWTPELQAQTTAAWNALLKDIEQAIADGADPASERAQALDVRWRELVAGFTGGNPEIAKGLNKLYADQANWQTDFKRPWSDEIDAYMAKVRAARK